MGSQMKVARGAFLAIASCFYLAACGSMNVTDPTDEALVIPRNFLPSALDIPQRGIAVYTNSNFPSDYLAALVTPTGAVKPPFGYHFVNATTATFRFIVLDSKGTTCATVSLAPGSSTQSILCGSRIKWHNAVDIDEMHISTLRAYKVYIENERLRVADVSEEMFE